MFRTLPSYEEDGLGLPYAVTLINAAEEEIDETTGEIIGIFVPDMEGLAAAVAMARVLMPAGLLPQEIRFLRDVLDLSSGDMAKVLMMNPATYSRWENGKQEVGQWADKQMRMVVVTTLRDRFPHFSVDPKTVTSLSPRKPKATQAAPRIQMIRRVLPAEIRQLDEWDTVPLAPAA
ncbi:XRE family transcriptional regulator [Gluconacetobacter sp. SXCC-1]|nr:XRE family transcriptional regulator [Gluconacetobacter sp. SXCC-1]